MKLTEFLKQRLLASNGVGYWPTLKALSFGYWSMLVHSGTFQHDGELIENVVKSGTLRVFVGGVLMTLVGLASTLVGLLATVLLLAGFVLLPLVAWGVQIAGTLAARRALRDMEKRVAAAREARNHGV